MQWCWPKRWFHWRPQLPGKSSHKERFIQGSFPSKFYFSFIPPTSFFFFLSRPMSPPCHWCPSLSGMFIVWQSGGKSTLGNKAKPLRHRKFGLMLIPSLFPFFNFFFFHRKACVFCVVWLSLCKRFAQSFLPWWDPADLGGGNAVVGHEHRCHQVPAGRGICSFPSIPALQHSNRRRYKSLSVFIHLLMPHFKVVGGFV